MVGFLIYIIYHSLKIHLIKNMKKYLLQRNKGLKYFKILAKIFIFLEPFLKALLYKKHLILIL